MALNKFNWFHGITEKVKEEPVTNYNAIAQSSTRYIQALQSDPKLLFAIVGDDENEDVYFIDLLIDYKTIRENDIIDMTDLDWFKLSSRLPLSISALQKYIDKVDWDYISKSYIYEKDETFLKHFGKRLNWENTANVNITATNAIYLVQNKIMPFEYSLQHILSREEAIANIDLISSCKENIAAFLTHYGAKVTELIGLNVDPVQFLEQCCTDGYIPVSAKYIECLQTGVKCRPEDSECSKDSKVRTIFRDLLVRFINRCKPNIEFIEKYILEYAIDSTWRTLSTQDLPDEFINKYKTKLNFKILVKYHLFDTATIKEVLGEIRADADADADGKLSRFTRLSPEFIDEYANVLDLYNLCEYQVLPEWLMNKHKRKLNWGQVSWHQLLSLDFIKENKQMLNHMKLESNTKMRKLVPFI